MWRIACALTLAALTPAAALELQGEPAVAAFIQDLAKRHGFEEQALRDLFRKVAWRPDVIEAITRPAEALPWHRYRARFVTASHIKAGQGFIFRHRAPLGKAERLYGVPPSVIAAIIGVETRYGTYMGRHRVVDALTTLAFRYPRRARFFRKELEAFLLLAREEGLDPLKPKGSYAGAMGLGQFMPSSFRRYGVDFDGDGRRDLWHPADAIGSVAHYLAAHGWERGGPIAMRARGRHLKASASLKPQTPLRGLGVDLPLPGDTPASLLALEGEEGPEYWVVFHNFYVITRYNRSPLYAMAVFQLAQALEGP